MENHTRERVRGICCIAVSFDRKLITSSLDGASRVWIPLSWRSIQEATRNEWLAAAQSRKRFSEIALQNVRKSSLMPKPTYEGHEQQRINAGRLKALQRFWVANYTAFEGDVVRDLAAQFLALAEK
jgi:hypothetical protein